MATVIETAIDQTAALVHLPAPTVTVSWNGAPGDSVLIDAACDLTVTWISLVVRTISQNRKSEYGADNKISEDHDVVDR